MKKTPKILKESEDTLRFFCPKVDMTFTFVLQKDGKVYPYSSTIDKEAFDNEDTLKNVFTVFATSIYNSLK